jgi:hypothetical protein
MFRCAGQRKGVVCLRLNNYGRCVVAVFQARRRRWNVACRKPVACMFTEGIWVFVRCLHCRRLMMCKYNYFDYMLILMTITFMAGKMNRNSGIREGWINGSLHRSLQHFLWRLATFF